MSAFDPADDLLAAIQDVHPDWRLTQLTDAWTTAGIGFEAVEPILRFMESNQEADYGAPGPLVHFMERFFRQGFEAKLIESLRRQPTSETVGMLNSWINAASADEERRFCLDEMKRVTFHDKADAFTVEQAEHYLRFQAGRR